MKKIIRGIGRLSKMGYLLFFGSIAIVLAACFGVWGVLTFKVGLK